MPSIKGYASEEGCHIITCIVGNKCDLNIKRTVKREEAESFAAATGSIYFETSAKTGYNVDELFLALGKLGGITIQWCNHNRGSRFNSEPSKVCIFNDFCNQDHLSW